MKTKIVYNVDNTHLTATAAEPLTEIPSLCSGTTCSCRVSVGCCGSHSNSSHSALNNQSASPPVPLVGLWEVSVRQMSVYTDTLHPVRLLLASSLLQILFSTSDDLWSCLYQNSSLSGKTFSLKEVLWCVNIKSTRIANLLKRIYNKNQTVFIHR